MVCDRCGAPATLRAETKIGLRAYCDQHALDVARALGLRLDRKYDGAGNPTTVNLSSTKNVDGYRGEGAFAKLSKLPASWNKGEGGDRGRDFVVGDFIVDVKNQRRYRDAMIPVSRDQQPNDATHYVFIVMPEANTFEYSHIGWCPRETMDAAPIFNPPDNGVKVPTRCLPFPELRPIGELLFRLEHGQWQSVTAPTAEEIGF